MSQENQPLIKELPDLKITIFGREKCLDEPLLEYVCEVADRFVCWEGDISPAPAIFMNRYIERNLTPEECVIRLRKMGVTRASLDSFTVPNYRKLDTSFKDKFLENEDLQNTIKAFDLDVSKFWYLLLFIYDYIEDFATNSDSLKKSEIQDISELVESLEDSTSLILRKGNKKKYVTDYEPTIKFVQTALNYYIGTYNDIIDQDLSVEEKLKKIKETGLDHFLHNGRMIDFEHKRTLETTFKKWKFAEMFQYFLKDKKANKSKIQTKLRISTDKLLLISRLIYTVGYDTKRYNEEYDSEGKKNRMLSNLLRKYKNENFPPAVGRYYLL